MYTPQEGSGGVTDLALPGEPDVLASCQEHDKIIDLLTEPKQH